MSKINNAINLIKKYEATINVAIFERHINNRSSRKTFANRLFAIEALTKSSAIEASLKSLASKSSIIKVFIKASTKSFTIKASSKSFALKSSTIKAHFLSRKSS